MRLFARARAVGVVSAMAIAGLGMVAPLQAAANDETPNTWNVTVGGGSPTIPYAGLDRFYPDNITVHPGDNVVFTWQGLHTVTFNPQSNLSLIDYAFAGTPTASNSLDTPTTFVNAAPALGPPGSPPPLPFDLAIGKDLRSGTYHYWCQVHQAMHGVIRVTRGELPSNDTANQTLAATQIAADQARAAQLDSRLLRNSGDEEGGALTGASDRVVELVNFYPSAITVRAGQRLTFTDRDTHEPHTVTFGPVPNALTNPFAALFPLGPGNPNAFDGTSTLNSGFMFLKSMYDYWNLKVSPIAAALPRTRFSVTFTTPGKYDFYCAIHGARIEVPPGSGHFIVVGMSGQITVTPAQHEDNASRNG
jgi:plastocyanin